MFRQVDGGEAVRGVYEVITKILSEEEQGKTAQSCQQPGNAQPAALLAEGEAAAEGSAEGCAGAANCGAEGQLAARGLLQVIVYGLALQII